MERRLAAILAADVVGYSRLMGADEVGTLAALRQLRAELFAPTVAGHRGKVVKSMGDGWLVEFASVVDAVTCAIVGQRQSGSLDERVEVIAALTTSWTSATFLQFVYPHIHCGQQGKLPWIA